MPIGWKILREDLRPHFAPQPLDAPRVRARYSDTNFQLLLAILSSVTARAVPALFDELLLEPLGLRATWFPGSPAPTGVPAPATVWVGREPLDRLLVFASVGDLYSSAPDAIAVLRALVSGRVFDDPTTFRRMTQRWRRFGFPRDRAALRSPGWPIEYGLGIMRFQLPRVFSPLRPMPAVIGHRGSTGSWLFYASALDLYVTGTVDQATAGAVPYRLVPKLLRAVERWLG